MQICPRNDHNGHAVHFVGPSGISGQGCSPLGPEITCDDDDAR